MLSNICGLTSILVIVLFFVYLTIRYVAGYKIEYEIEENDEQEEEREYVEDKIEEYYYHKNNVTTSISRLQQCGLDNDFIKNFIKDITEANNLNCLLQQNIDDANYIEFGVDDDLNVIPELEVKKDGHNK